MRIDGAWRWFGVISSLGPSLMTFIIQQYADTRFLLISFESLVLTRTPGPSGLAVSIGLGFSVIRGVQ